MIWNQGVQVLDLSYKVAAGVTTYLASASRSGMSAFRFVQLDASHLTPGPGEEYRPPVKYLSTGFTNGEKVIGVVTRSQDTNSAKRDYDPAPFFYPTAPGKAVTVRHLGVAPVFADSTVSGTPILVGDFVKSSVTSNYDGCACKATLTNNAPAANAHIGGVALNRVAGTGHIVLVMLRPQEV